MQPALPRHPLLILLSLAPFAVGACGPGEPEKVRDVSLYSCQARGSVASVQVEIHNRAGSPRDYEVLVEYRDSSGQTAGAGTIVERDVPAGATLRPTAQVAVADTDSWGAGDCKITRVY